MGGKRKSGGTPKPPSGVAIRTWPSGKTTLRISFYFRGVRCYETLKIEATAANLKYADRLRSEIMNAIERGTFCYTDYFPNSKRARIFGHTQERVTVEELIRDFLKQSKLTKETSTYKGYIKVCNAHILPVFGKLAIQDLQQPSAIRRWVSEMNCTAKTMANILVPLRTVIEIALVDQLIKENPLNNIIISKLINKNTKKSDYKPDPFDINEINAILAESEGQLKNLFQFAFFSGLRVSELIGLRWQDIDWVHGIIKVEEAVVAKEAKGPKTEAGVREVMLLPPARDALLEQKEYTFKYQNRIFYNPRTGKPWETSQQIRRTAWTYILQRAGVRYRNPYQTRHTFASMMLSQGENIMWVSKQLGHVDVEMVIKTYGRWIPDQSTQTGYRPVHNWGSHLTKTVPIWCPNNEGGGKNTDKSTIYMVEAAGIEPAGIFCN